MCCLLMDNHNTVSNKDANGCVNKPVTVDSSDCRKIEDHVHVNGNNDRDSNSLLQLPKRGGISKQLNKTCSRRVQWNDMAGNKLVEVWEYEASDSDSEDEDSCMCSIM